MTSFCKCLLPYESLALIAALRRDFESETSKASLAPQWADYHMANARMSSRISETITDYIAGEMPRSSMASQCNARTPI